MRLHRAVWTRLSTMWDRESIFTAFLVFLVGKAFVLPVVITVGMPGRLAEDVFLSLALIAGVMSVPLRRWVFNTLLAVTLMTLSVHWLSWLFRPEVTAAAREWATLATLASLATVVLAKVLSAGSVTRTRIKGAVAAYLLLGLSWASAYTLVHLYQPGSFQGNLVSSAPGQDFSYFSFLTLTTVGYGDIAPVLPLARSLAVTEALTGQLYVAILLARLVSLELLQRNR